MSFPGSSHLYDSSTDPKNPNPNHSMLASQQHNQPSLYRTTGTITSSSRDTPQSWPPPYDDQTSASTLPFSLSSHEHFPYRSGFLSTSASSSLPYTLTGTTPCSPPPSYTPVSSNTSRLGIAGSFDPTTGIFCRMPEHPRLRTAQACEKCRMRKAKCSGERPSCKRCLARGYECEYAKEGRVRGPNRVKSSSVSSSSRNIIGGSTTTSTSSTTVAVSQADQSSSIRNTTGSSVEQPRSSSSASSQMRGGTKAQDTYIPNSHEENAQQAFPPSMVPLDTSRAQSPPPAPLPSSSATRIDALGMSQNTSSSTGSSCSSSSSTPRVSALSQRLYPPLTSLSSSISAPLISSSGYRRHSHPRPFHNLGIQQHPHHTNLWRQDSALHQHDNWVLDRSSGVATGLDAHVGMELGTLGAQAQQGLLPPSLGRPLFVKQQQQQQQVGGYLLEEQQRRAFQHQQQHHNGGGGSLPHQHSAPSLLEYQQTPTPPLQHQHQQQAQGLSYPSLYPIPQQQHQQSTDGGAGTLGHMYHPSQYNDTFPSTMNARGVYTNNNTGGGGMGYILSGMGEPGHGRSYRVGGVAPPAPPPPSRRREVNDLGLLPSLSRRPPPKNNNDNSPVEQQQQQPVVGSASEGELKEEGTFVDHHQHHQPTGVVAAQEGEVEDADGQGDQAVKWE